MLLMLAVLMMTAARRFTIVSDNRAPSYRRVRRRGFPVFALGVAMALVSIPGGAWANAAATPTPANEVGSAAASTLGMKTAAASESNEYAAREVKAHGLEKFEGGDTTVVIGGSALVIIIVVILILVLI